MPASEIIFFSRKNILHWNKELNHIDLDKLQKQLNPIQLSIILLGSELSEYLEKIQEIKKNLIVLKKETQKINERLQKIDSSNSISMNFTDENYPQIFNPLLEIPADINLLTHHEAKELISKTVESAKKSVMNFYDLTRLQTICEQIKSLDCEYKSLSDKKMEIERELSVQRAEEKKINTIIMRYDDLEQRIKKAENFLTLLENSPDRVLNSFFEKIKLLLTRFEENHLFDQSRLTRLCLLELKEKMEAIKENYKINNKTGQRRLFFLLCGLVHYISDKLNSHAQNKSEDNLRLLLLSLIADFHIAKFNSLPDEMAEEVERESCVSYFQKFKNYYQDYMKDLSESDLLNFEILQYSNAIQKLKSIEGCSEAIKQHIQQIISMMNKQKNENDNFDHLKFYTTILDTVFLRISYPANVDITNKFIKLIDSKIEEAPSLSAKLFGAALTAIGTLIAARGSFAGVSIATLGIYAYSKGRRSANTLTYELAQISQDIEDENSSQTQRLWNKAARIFTG